MSAASEGEGWSAGGLSVAFQINPPPRVGLEWKVVGWMDWGGTPPVSVVTTVGTEAPQVVEARTKAERCGCLPPHATARAQDRIGPSLGFRSRVDLDATIKTRQTLWEARHPKYQTARTCPSVLIKAVGGAASRVQLGSKGMATVMNSRSMKRN